ncbi:MAG TPA: twin-arginine translocation signal domain-containing protein, partial [Terriglobia bacterium]|nr:twin-arginine translocation signal domain-containing protein [Terriglobia bacterium]
MKEQPVSRRSFIQGAGASTAGLMISGLDLELDGKPLSRTVSADAAMTAGAPGVSGQGDFRFRVLRTSADLPKQAQQVLVKAHGGFAVDRRPGQGETYFFLPGAGILEI